MPKNKLSDLRNHLFETLEELKDKENPMDVKRANAISGVAQQIIESAKAEIQFMKVVDEIGDTSFFAGRPELEANAKAVVKQLGTKSA